MKEDISCNIVSVVRGRFDGTNGLERVFYDLSSALRQNGCRHKLFCYEGMISDHGKKILKDNGAEVVLPSLFAGKIINASSYYLLFLSLLKYCIFNRPKIIVGHYSKPSNVAVLVGYLLNIPVVRVIHTDNPPSHGISRKILKKIINKKSIHTVAVAEAIKKNEIDSGVTPKRLSVIYHGIDSKNVKLKGDVKQIRKSLGISEEAFLLLIAASLVPIKGHKFLLNALARLRTNEVFLVIAGKGELESELRQEVGMLGIDHRIKFVGHVDNISDYIAASDCVVLPSLKDAFPQILIEAMQLAKPVIASRVGGVPESVSDGVTGILVAPGDVDGLENAITQLMGNKEKCNKMGQEGRIRAERLFNINATVRDYLKLFNVMY